MSFCVRTFDQHNQSDGMPVIRVTEYRVKRSSLPLEEGRGTLEGLRLVINNNAEVTGVVLQVIVIDAEKQAAGAADPDGAAIVAEKKVIAGGPDTADERRGGTILHGKRGFIGRDLFASRNDTMPGLPLDYDAILLIA